MGGSSRPQGWLFGFDRSHSAGAFFLGRAIHLGSPSGTDVCLGGAFTKDTGQRGPVRGAPRVVVLEGRLIDCAPRMMNGVLPEVSIEVIRSDQLARFDRQLLGSDPMPDAQIRACARQTALELLQILPLFPAGA
jgi:hypothetical protein